MVQRLLGDNMVMGLSEQEEVRPITFYWYAEEDDFDEDGNLNLTITAGRLRHKWVPTRKTSAMLFIRENEGATGLRARKKQLQLVRIFSFDVEDVTEKYPQAVVEGLHGMVIKTPITLSIPKGRRGISIPPFYTAGDKDIYSPLSTSEVGSIQSGILSDQDILDMSVVEVTSPVAFQDDAENTAAVGGVYDSRMCSIVKNVPCQTCGKVRLEKDASNSCPGHFGHISLEVPIPKILYMGIEKRIGRQGYPLLFTFNHVCHTCYKVPLPDEILKPIMPLLEQQFELGRKNYRGYENLKQFLGKHLTNGGKKDKERNALIVMHILLSLSLFTPQSQSFSLESQMQMLDTKMVRQTSTLDMCERYWLIFLMQRQEYWASIHRILGPKICSME